MNHSKASLSRALFVLIFVTCGYFYQGGFSNQNTRLDYSLSLVFKGTGNIDDFHHNTIDKVKKGEHYYIDKAPGLSYFLVPFLFFVAKTTDSQVHWLESDAAANMLQHLCTLWAVVLPVAIAAVCFFYTLFILVPGLSLHAAFFITLSCFLATLCLPYSTMMFGHMLAAALLVIGFYLGLIARDNKLLLASYFCLAFAVLVEFPVAIHATAIFFSILLRKDKNLSYRFYFKNLWIIAFPAAALATHNYGLFSDSTSLGYGQLQGTIFYQGMSKGFFGISLPSPSVVVELLFKTYRGLFIYSPILIMGIIGFFFASGQRFLLPLYIGLVAHLLAISGYSFWQGGTCFGPRHLVPSIPFVAMGLAYLPPNCLFHPLTLGSFAVSLFINFLGTSTTPFVHESVQNPLKIYLDLFTDEHLAFNPHGFFSSAIDAQQRWNRPELFNNAAFNLGILAGLGGLKSIFPLLSFWIVALWFLQRRLFRIPGLGNSVTCLGGALCFALWLLPMTRTYLTTLDDVEMQLRSFEFATFWNESWEYIVHSRRLGFVLTAWLAWVPYLQDNIFYFHFIRFAGVFLCFSGYTYLLCTLTEKTIISIAIAVLTFLLYPHHSEHDPLTSFPFIFSTLQGLLFFSFAFFFSKKPFLQRLALLFFVIAIVSYEAFIPLLLTYFLFVAIDKEIPWKRTIPYVISTFLWVVIYFAFQFSEGSRYDGTMAQFDLKKMFDVFFSYSFATSPSKLIVETIEDWNFISFFSQASSLQILLIVIFIGIWARTGKEKIENKKLYLLFAFGLLQIFLPQLAISTSLKYQRWVEAGGNIYLTSFFSHFGIGVCLAAAELMLRQAIANPMLSYVYRSFAIIAFVISIAGSLTISSETYSQEEIAAQRWKLAAFVQERNLENKADIIWAPIYGKTMGIVNPPIEYWRRVFKNSKLTAVAPPPDLLNKRKLVLVDYDMDRKRFYSKFLKPKKSL